MTLLDFIIDIAGTIAGWAAIILGLAWAASRFSRREIYIIQAGGNFRKYYARGPSPTRRPPARFPRYTRKTQ